MSKKLFLSGISGIGKTTLAKAVSERYGIPFVNGSSKVLWEKYDIKDHQDLIHRSLTDIDFGIQFQYELLKVRRESITGLDSFVTDRSPLDNLVYTMLQVSSNMTKEQNEDYINTCKISFPYNSKLLLLSPIETDLFSIPLENDGFRVTNPYYQSMVDTMFMKSLQKMFGNSNPFEYSVCASWDWDKRWEVVQSLIGLPYDTL